jgi:hypothetical protein
MGEHPPKTSKMRLTAPIQQYFLVYTLSATGKRVFWAARPVVEKQHGTEPGSAEIGGCRARADHQGCEAVSTNRDAGELAEAANGIADPMNATVLGTDVSSSGRIVAIVSRGMVQPSSYPGKSNAPRCSHAACMRASAREVAAEGLTMSDIGPGRIEACLSA